MTKLGSWNPRVCIVKGNGTFGLAAFFALLFLLTGCEGPRGPAGSAGAAGDKGQAGPAGATGAKGDQGAAGKDVDPKTLADIKSKLDEAANVQPESCAICHAEYGEKKHQSIYDKYSDTSKLAMTWVSAMSTANSDGTYDTTVTFKITKSGLPYLDIKGLPSLEQKTFYSVQYASATKTFDKNNSFSSKTVTPVTGQPGYYTVNDADVPYDITASGFNGHFFAYIADGLLDTESGGHVHMYDDVASMGKAFGTEATTPYVSPANVSACEKCHGKPYMKHGYRNPKVSGLGDFASCKVCHYDTRTGHDEVWQLMVDKPSRWAALDKLAKAAAAKGDKTKDSIRENMTAAELKKYGYKAKLMNDVHMAHSMEFPYPQSMANCATCHEGKLTTVFDDSNFVKETCKSCHPWTGESKYGTDKNAMESIWKRAGSSILTLHQATSSECNVCHKAGGAAQTKRLSNLHNGGYDPMIYTKNGAKRWSDVFKAKIDSATFASSTNKLTVEFSATEVGGASTNATYDADDITPILMIGLYGYNTKDFIVAAHDKDSKGNRLLELSVDGKTTNPRFKVLSSSNAKWKIEVDLSNWSKMITAKTIKRAEIDVRPMLSKAVNGKDVNVGTCSPACSHGQHCDKNNKCVKNDDIVFALNAQSRTFDLAKNAFADTYYSDIVDVKKCNSCHDALATTFHTGDRGGNIRVCRTCHVVLKGSSHLEMQSRSLDSYVHAIHSFQAFDVGDIDFKDPVAKLRYENHIEHVFPNFTIKNCEACHKEGTFENPPDQSKSLPGVLSGSDKVANRNIGTVKSYVTGPGARVCGSCHRSQMINEDEAGELVAFYQHHKTNGYMVESTKGVLDKIIETIMKLFN